MKRLFACLIVSFFAWSVNANAVDTPAEPPHGIDQLSQQLERARLVKGPCTITLPNKTWHFYADRSRKETLYISNHDQHNPKSVGILLDGLRDLVIDGQGSTLLCHGKMIPIVMRNCKNCYIRNFQIDFASPAICQGRIIANDPKGITVKLDAGVNYKVENGRLFFNGPGWTYSPQSGIAFDPVNRNLVFNSSDIGVDLSNVRTVGDGVFFCPKWQAKNLPVGTVFAFRPSDRPAPAILLDRNEKTTLKNITIHYAEGMGVLAQLCDSIHFDNVSVCLKGENDPRYFTTQADATHFSGCRGIILSENSLYEGMMDDAINIHGTYLKVTKRVDDHTLQGAYMHNQAWGFPWGKVGDEVQFIDSQTMELFPGTNTIKTIRPIDRETDHGAKVFEIVFKDTIPPEVNEQRVCGIENLQWTPEVIFRHNVIRNNRARGALFSTPRKTIVENNFFDHTSGTAILLCGDCNGWFETGACREVIIRDNRFKNALTCMFQFTNAVISIYPEIPNLKDQKQYFHGGKPDAILIENNLFEMFDQPILYAKSVDGLTFRGNTIKHNNDFPAWHWNKYPFLLERVKNFQFQDNKFDGKFDPETQIHVEANFK